MSANAKVLDRMLDMLIADAVQRGEIPPRPDDVTPYQWWVHYLYEDGQDCYVNDWLGAGHP